MRHTVYEDRPAWLADRRSAAPDYSLGSTDVAAILGVYFYGPWRVWAKAKRPELAPDDKPNDAMMVGSEWEPIACEWYRRHCADGVDVDDRLSRASNPDVPWLRVSPDALVGDAGGLEIKVPRSRSGWWDPTEFRSMSRRVLDHVPASYALQVNAMLLATGREWWDLCALFSPHDVRIYRFHRDERYLESLRRRLESWRSAFLLGDATPEWDASKEARRYVTTGDRADKREATEDEAEIMLRIAAHRATEKAAKEAKQTETTRLMSMMGEAKTVWIPMEDAPQPRATVSANGRLTLRNA
ncbi:YqaJ viral recombinase family protein [bacterium]|nr:YqaJ viral recombinase family protein [bacterium]